MDASPVTTLGGAKIWFAGEPSASPFLATAANMTGQPLGEAAVPMPGEAASSGPVVAWKNGCAACQAEPALVGSGMQCLIGCEGVTLYELVSRGGRFGIDRVEVHLL